MITKKIYFPGGSAPLFDEGTFTTEILKVHEAGFEAMSAFDIFSMVYHTFSTNFMEKVWGPREFLTSVTGIAATADKIWIFPQTIFLHELSQNNSFTQGGIAFKDNMPVGVKVYERKDIEPHLNRHFRSKADLFQLPILKDLFEGDESFLAEYFDQLKTFEKNEGHEEGMGLFVPKDESPIMRALTIWNHQALGKIDGTAPLDKGYVQLVGKPGEVR